MDSKLYTDYQILKSIEENSELSQRLMSKHTGINVASVNFALKRLVQRGYVRITNLNKRRILYNLTSRGMTRKGTLAYNFFINNYNLFSDIREIILERLDAPELKEKSLAIFGVTKITEIVYLCMKKKGVRFAGIYENQQKKKSEWIDCETGSLDDLKKNREVDFVVDLKSGAKDFLNFEIMTPDNLVKKYTLRENGSVSSASAGGVEIEILGAGSSVTGSCTILKANGKNILIDCGLYQGGREESAEKNSGFSFAPKDIDYLILTHAHIDHSGRIPHLIDQGFRGEILSHHASVDIYPHLLEDGFRLNPELKLVLDREKLLEKVIAQSWGFEYGRWNQISKGISFRLLDAGHILGSATVQFNINGEYIVFSGDIGNKNTGIIRDPQIPDRADTLIMESTYGGRAHKDLARKTLFCSVVKKAIKDGGKLLIPAFAVGRTQEIIYQLNDLVEKGEINDVPVFVDTPLGIKITELYEKHKECFDTETLKRFQNRDDPLDFHKLFSVEKHSDSIRLGEIEGPAIIIAGSGMCTGGRIVNHLETLLEDPKTDLLFVGYQAENTLGAEIVKYARRESGYVNINGNRIYIKAAVHQMSGFSAHADHHGLLDWFDGIEEKPHTVYLNHGEVSAQIGLKKSLNERYPDMSVRCGFE